MSQRRRHQFTFYASYFDAVENLPRSRRYETLQALILYALEGIYPQELKGAARGVFDAIRPNLDSSRARAQKALRDSSAEDGEQDPETPRSPSDRRVKARTYENAYENEREYENEYEYETEREQEKETEKEGEGSGPAASPAPCPAGEAFFSASSLSEIQQPHASSALAGAEALLRQAPYREMLRQDPNLIYFWRALLDTGQGGRRLSRRAQRELLRELQALPPWERPWRLTEYADHPEKAEKAVAHPGSL